MEEGNHPDLTSIQENDNDPAIQLALQLSLQENKNNSNNDSNNNNDPEIRGHLGKQEIEDPSSNNNNNNGGTIGSDVWLSNLEEQQLIFNSLRENSCTGHSENPFNKLSDEITLRIMDEIVQSSDNAQKRKNIRMLALLNKNFNRLMKDQQIQSIALPLAQLFIDEKNPQKVSPGWIACKYNMADFMVEYLKANPDFVNAKDAAGMTPLIQAIRGNSRRIAKLLLENGADINLKDNYPGWTALDWAIRTDSKRWISKLKILKIKKRDWNKSNYREPLYDSAITLFRATTSSSSLERRLLAKYAISRILSFKTLSKSMATSVFGLLGLVWIYNSIKAPNNPGFSCYSNFPASSVAGIGEGSRGIRLTSDEFDSVIFQRASKLMKQS